ncbi:MAG: 6-carboxytetrahydropterin synthase [Phycisphaeraceae bacterium]|nr:6-carboxytetrahydropterin synthase [Phycisphaeraceae bacterium]
MSGKQKPRPVVELSRTVRFCIGGDEDEESAPVDNSFAAWPPMRGLGRFYQIHLLARGEPDPRTGYFINITVIDRAARLRALPLMRQAIGDDPHQGRTVALGRLLQDMFQAVDEELEGRLVELHLELTPYLRFTSRGESMPYVTIAHQYEFSASHRLHVPELSDRENVAIFGKCNNPAGHGHNYRLEVSVRTPVDERGGLPEVSRLDRIIDQHVVDVLDHKHLNSDVEHFANLNPSVENIARIIFSLLESPIRNLDDAGRAELEAVTVWETGKTSCTYRGDD